jgi:hypothetical protein
MSGATRFTANEYRMFSADVVVYESNKELEKRATSPRPRRDVRREQRDGETS